jgi:tubby-related protein 1
MASTKNFSLVKEEGDRRVLQFGKVSDKTFILDFTYPLTPLQAFLIGVSSMSSKIGCD